jgi:uncharacterized protein (DUF58 family)
MLAQEILLRAKKHVFTNRSAGELSKIRGEGLDFCEIRPYETGDDIRKINFSASGKTGELQTNIFNENKQINVVICIALSSSLHFGSQRLKSEVIAEIMALISCSSIKQQNKTQLVFFTDKAQPSFQLNNTGDTLRAIEAILSWDLLKTEFDFQALNQYLLQQQKSMAFIIGDFYHDNDYSLIAHKHQANAIIVRDKLEENPNFGSELDLINAEHGSCVKANMNKKLALKYQSKLHIQDNKLFSHFTKHRIIAGKLYTCDNAFIKLNQILRS